MIQAVNNLLDKEEFWRLLDAKKTLEDRYGFRTFEPRDRLIVEEYSGESIFFDLSFTNFWAWSQMFHYRYCVIDDILVVTYVTLDHTPAAILFPGRSRSFKNAVSVVRDLFGRLGYPAVFEYVPDTWLPLYRNTGMQLEITSQRDWSDYVYRVDDFVALEGGENRTKRRELKLFTSLGDVEFCPLNKDSFDVMLKIFDSWCAWHDCENCFFGCERQAFAKLGDIWNIDHYYGGIASLDGEPVGFALGETLGGCACYSFQKNIENYRGLTYFLSYNCAINPKHPPCLNWCEDMGLGGLRENKLRYRPSEIVSKYTVKIRS